MSDESFKPPSRSDNSLSPSLNYIGTKTIKFVGSCLKQDEIGAVNLVKNADIDKFKYSGRGFGFDIRGTFSVGNGFGKNVLIFAADMSSFIPVDNK